MLRRILIASAAAAMLLVTFTPDDAFVRRGGGIALEVFTAAEPCEREATAAALSQFEELGAVLSLCAAGATAIGVGPIAATVSVRRQWARLRSAPLRPEPTAAAVTTPTATTFAPAATVRTERRDAVGPWCLKPITKSSA